MSVSLVEEGSLSRIRLAGALDQDNLVRAWREAVSLVRARKSPPVVVDARALRSCDGSGIAVLVEIERLARESGGSARFEGLSESLRRLVERALARPGEAVAPPRRPGLVAALGGDAVAGVARLYGLTAFLGEVTRALGLAALAPRRLRRGDLLLAIERAGPGGVPVVCLLGGLIGLVFAFEGVAPFSRYGAVSKIPTFLAIALARELGPLITAIILSGRTGAAFAAELGTMKVTEEIDALRTLGIDPVRLLVVPRVLAAMLVTPLLGLFATASGLAGGFVVMASLGFGWHFYIEQIKWAVTRASFLLGVSKGLAFGFVVGATGCAHGLATREGPGAVGMSTTRSVVVSIILLIVLDGVFAFVWYSWGR